MNVSPGSPAAFPHQTQGLHPFFCFPPTPCQLKSHLSRGGSWVTLSMAQLRCVPALFSVFFLFASPPRPVSAFPPAVALTKGAAGSHGPVCGRVQARPRKAAAEPFWG